MSTHPDTTEHRHSLDGGKTWTRCDLLDHCPSYCEHTSETCDARQVRSLLPFSPISHRRETMKFDPADTFTYDTTPLRTAWEEAYKRAAIEIVYRDSEEARTWARTGLDMEAAYMDRSRAEWQAEQANR